jgi:hypothetical protein
MEGAFALLRYAARGERMKLHDLARAVVDNDETPEPVIRALARHSSILPGAPRAERIARTEHFFRAVNEELALIPDVEKVVARHDGYLVVRRSPVDA